MLTLEDNLRGNLGVERFPRSNPRCCKVCTDSGANGPTRVRCSREADRRQIDVVEQVKHLYPQLKRDFLRQGVSLKTEKSTSA